LVIVDSDIVWFVSFWF